MWPSFLIVDKPFTIGAARTSFTVVKVKLAICIYKAVPCISESEATCKPFAASYGLLLMILKLWARYWQRKFKKRFMITRNWTMTC